MEVPASIRLEQDAAPPPPDVTMVQSVPDDPREVPVTAMLSALSQVEGAPGFAVKVSPENCS
jgi:hypothetical protein